MNEASEWRRSSFCSAGSCAEVKIEGDVVLLRNSRFPESTVELTAAEWEALKQGIVGGDFERPGD